MTRVFNESVLAVDDSDPSTFYRITSFKTRWDPVKPRGTWDVDILPRSWVTRDVDWLTLSSTHLPGDNLIWHLWVSFFRVGCFFSNSAQEVFRPLTDIDKIFQVELNPFKYELNPHWIGTGVFYYSAIIYRCVRFDRNNPNKIMHGM